MLAGESNSPLDKASWRPLLAQKVARVRADVSFAITDAVIVVIAYAAAQLLAFIDIEGLSARWWHGFLIALPFILVIHLATNLAFGTYGHVWKFASVEEAMRIVASVATAMGSLFFLIFAYRLTGAQGPIPYMVLAAGAMLTLGGMGAVRFRSRMFSFKRGVTAVERPRTLVVGTGQAAVDLARRGPAEKHPVQVVGFASNNGEPSSRKLAGLPVLGRLENVPDLVRWLDIDQVVIAENLGDEALRNLVDRCITVDVRLRILPDVDEVLSSNGAVRDIRDLVLTDLLPRPAVSTQLGRVECLLTDKRVLVTGAGGSIGSEIIRQVQAFMPDRVIALDNDETHLYDAMMRWHDGPMDPEIVLCDIRDGAALADVFAQCRPDIVFHAAAHKHVPILEAYPAEAIKTNVIGTENVLRSVRQAGVERFVLVSTDKAVDPTSVMGASKRVAEMMMQAAAAAHGGVTKYSAVRFGNVLGSRGSVIPTFMYQIQHGGPVTVSDPRMERYFMTIGEAVELVLQASALADGGEVFVLDMGEPVRIIDLAHRIIRLAGLVPGRDIEVAITGARPGEKLREVLSLEPLVPGPHPKINKAEPGHPGAITLMDSVALLGDLAGKGDAEAIRETLHGLTSRTWTSDEVISLREMPQRTPRKRA